jgi:crotonobetainyl-CoA:carnitine CoA-transferase CaiB-like acyl-CoA transferase
VQFDEQPAQLRRAPEHGQHSEEILQELGCDWEAIRAFKRAGVVL